MKQNSVIFCGIREKYIDLAEIGEILYKFYDNRGNMQYASLA